MEQSHRTTVASGSEIGIADLWRSIIRRKGLVLSIFIASIGASLLFLVFAKPVYQARSLLLVGQVAGAGPMEPIEQLSLRLESKYGRRIADGVYRERPFLVTALPVKSLPGGIELVVEAYGSAEATVFLSGIVVEVQKSHAQLFERNMSALSERLIGIDTQLKALASHYEDASSVLGRLKDRDPVQASLVFMDRGRVAAQMIELEAERPRILQKLAPPQTQPTQLMNEVTAPAVPNFPKRTSTVALAGVVGLLVGVLLAIVIEYAGTVAVPRRS